MRRFEIEEQGESGRIVRFWHVTQRGRAVQLDWGVAGGRASQLVKELPTEGKARAEVRRLVRQHVAKGYVEVTGDSE